MQHHHQSSYGGGYPGQAYRQQPPPNNPYPYGQPSQQPYGSHAPHGSYGVCQTALETPGLRDRGLTRTLHL